MIFCNDAVITRSVKHPNDKKERPKQTKSETFVNISANLGTFVSTMKWNSPVL